MRLKSKTDDTKPISRLRKLRLEKEVSLKDLARRSGVDKGTIDRIEQGKNRPYLSTLNRLAQVLEVDLDTDEELKAMSYEATTQLQDTSVSGWRGLWR